MHSPSEHSYDEMSHRNCGCGNCGIQDELDYGDEEEIYDDPYDVVMYDLDASDDLYALIDMLADTTRSWYAKRRLNALAASGPLSALVAAIIIDSLGRRWDPLLHPRDRFGRFIETGGFLRWLSKGKWLRGQVARIDSDGNIHVRSAGNDGVADGAVFRFKPELANKLVSTEEPVASLSKVNLDADIPGFPEASEIQKRIWNTLAVGDMPAADIDRAMRDLNLTSPDFTNEISGLEERGLIRVDRTGDVPRVRRDDDGAQTAVDVTDIDDVPEDETPDLDDSPALTKVQRDLLDSIVDADRGEGDGVSRDELDAADDADIQALIDAGALEENEDGRLFLENPEGGDASEESTPAETDIVSEIFDAAGERFDDVDVQEAFQHYAEELARPGDENNAPAPEGVPAAKLRTAKAAAEKWWADRTGGTQDDDAPAEGTPEADVPAAKAKDVLNPRNQALADTLLAEYFPDDEFLDSTAGVEYRGALKRLFDAEDLEENGFDVQAESERAKALRTMQKLEVEEDYEGWEIEVRNMRNADLEQSGSDDGSEVAEDVVPDVDTAESLRQSVHTTPETDLPEDATSEGAPEASPDADIPEEGFTVEPTTAERWSEYEDRLNEEGLADEFYARLEQEAQLAEELGLDHFDDNAPWSWQNMSENVGYRVAELMFNDNDGSIGKAGAADLDKYQRQYENELLQKFTDRGGNAGPEVLQLRRAGLIEADNGGNSWKLTKEGEDRLGLVRDLPSESDLVDDAPDVEPQNEEDLAVEEVDLPTESELAPVENNPWKIEARNGLVFEDLPGLENPEDWGYEERAVAAQRVAQALWDAQQGAISRDAAYGVAADQVVDGHLTQKDLEDIQSDVKRLVENNGRQWDVEREIDYVGDDQRNAPEASPAPPPLRQRRRIRFTNGSITKSHS